VSICRVLKGKRVKTEGVITHPIISSTEKKKKAIKKQKKLNNPANPHKQRLKKINFKQKCNKTE